MSQDHGRCLVAVESRILQRSRDVSPREMYRLHHKKLVLSRCSKERLYYVSFGIFTDFAEIEFIK